MIAVRVQQEVVDYLRLLAPKPHHAIRIAIKNLAHETGNFKALCDELEGFYRLRIGSHRVIFEYEFIEQKRVITCVFAGPRKWIYEVFQSQIME